MFSAVVLGVSCFLSSVRRRRKYIEAAPPLRGEERERDSTTAQKKQEGPRERGRKQHPKEEGGEGSTTQEGKATPPGWRTDHNFIFTFPFYFFYFYFFTFNVFT